MNLGGEKMIFIVSAVVIGLLSSSFLASAGDVQIENKVNVSAETGNNRGGNVSEGKSRVEIEVNQEVDGEKLDPVRVFEELQGEPIQRTVEVKTKDGKVETKIETFIDKLEDPVFEDNGLKPSENLEVFQPVREFLSKIGNYIVNYLTLIFI